MIISAKIVWKPRTIRRCGGCHKLIHGPAIRLYGYANRGDTPYAVYCHPTANCTGGGDRVINLLVRYEKECHVRDVEVMP